ncbi:hypothetical protein B0A48_15522 [Cryoendolithus antarcticus]|uniref:75k gamma secalin n=1 Tax=Cryoendolithus antarcticus TaxID=1507870 RepID=A0A1V8SGI5_9PEZI|nr:hypothetical protein B0A48_15522 [Cryoendolithus antarcticus]
MPPYQGYQIPTPMSHQDYGAPSRLQTQMPHRQTFSSIPAGHPVAPTSHQRGAAPQRNGAWQQPHVNYQHMHHPPYVPQYSTPPVQQYQSSTPLQHFAGGQLRGNDIRQRQPSGTYHPSGPSHQAPRVATHQQARQPQAPRLEARPAPPQVYTQHPPAVHPGLAPKRADPSGIQAVKQPPPFVPSPSQAPRSVAQPLSMSQSQGLPATKQQLGRKPLASQGVAAYDFSQRHTQTMSDAKPTPPAPGKIAYVQIPTHHAVDKVQKTSKPQSRAPKRRKSNEGVAVHVTPIPAPVPLPSKLAHQPTKLPLSAPAPSVQPAEQVPRSVHDLTVLLALADEYLTAAHSMSAHLCSGNATEEHWEIYHAMIATALGCLESASKDWGTHEPRKQARIRLKLAEVLLEETTNSEELADLLVKGIDHCERERLIEIKYALKHLEVRAQFRSSPKSAFKLAETAIADAQAQGLQRWVYAFRFLRISLSMQPGGPSETASTLKHLTELTVEADARQDVAVQIVAASLEAIMHVHSNRPDALESAQRALTAARTHHLAPEMEQLPQMCALLDCLDLACSLSDYQNEQAKNKTDRLHHDLDKRTRTNAWSKDGSFLITIGEAAAETVEADTAGVFLRTASGELALPFQWLSRSQLYMLGYSLTGSGLLWRNSEDRKAETFIAQGLKLNQPLPDGLSLSVRAYGEMQAVQRRMALEAKLVMIFAYCTRANWASAADAIDDIRGDSSYTADLQDETTAATLLYLAGVCKHGLGDLETALSVYQSPSLTIDPRSKAAAYLRDLRLLAGLNQTPILRSLNPASAYPLLATLHALCQSHTSPSIRSAYQILAASSSPSSLPIIKQKQYLQAALTPAQVAKNSQMLSIIMNTMTEMFFTGIVGKQAFQSADAGTQLATKSADPLWGVVAQGMYRSLLARSGEVGKVDIVEKRVRQGWEKVPEGVRERLEGQWEKAREVKNDA